tara:strand:+ start:6052 stop:6840 length:789 start_codon:yes stop_codon:yes gene_type:complete
MIDGRPEPRFLYRMVELAYQIGGCYEEIYHAPFEDRFRATFADDLGRQHLQLDYHISDFEKHDIDLNETLSILLPNRPDPLWGHVDVDHISEAYYQNLFEPTCPYFIELLPFHMCYYGHQDISFSGGSRFRYFANGHLVSDELLSYPSKYNDSPFIYLSHPWLRDDERYSTDFLLRLQSSPSNQIDKIVIYNADGSDFCCEYLRNNRFRREWVKTYSEEGLVKYIHIDDFSKWLDDTVEEYQNEEFKKLFSHTIQDIIWESN